MRDVCIGVGLALLAAAPAGLAPAEALPEALEPGLLDQHRGASANTILQGGVGLAVDPDLWPECYAAVLNVYAPGITTGTVTTEPSPVSFDPQPVCGVATRSWLQVEFIPVAQAYDCADAQVVVSASALLTNGRICNAHRWTMHGNLVWYEYWGFGGASAVFLLERGVIVADMVGEV